MPLKRYKMQSTGDCYCEEKQQHSLDFTVDPEILPVENFNLCLSITGSGNEPFSMTNHAIVLSIHHPSHSSVRFGKNLTLQPLMTSVLIMQLWLHVISWRNLF